MLLSSDGRYLSIDSELVGKNIRRTYDLNAIERSHGTWNATEFHPSEVLEPTNTHTHVWKVEPGVLSMPSTSPYLFWELNQLPTPPFGAPNRVSTVILYVTVPQNDINPSPGQKVWRIGQHYSDAHGPCAKSRTIATLSRPVLGPNEADEHGMPLVCLSFNQFGWVTEEDDNEALALGTVEGEEPGDRARRRTKRVLKLMTFPDPGEVYEGDLSSSAKTLDIPSSVLDQAYHVVLDSTQGLVMVGTLSNALFVYKYSR